MLLCTTLLFMVGLKLGAAVSPNEVIAQYCIKNSNGTKFDSITIISSFCRRVCYSDPNTGKTFYADQGAPCFNGLGKKMQTCDGKGNCNGPAPDETKKFVDPLEPAIQACYKARDNEEGDAFKGDDYKTVTNLRLSRKIPSKDCKLQCVFQKSKQLNIINSGEPCQLKEGSDAKGKCNDEAECVA